MGKGIWVDKSTFIEFSEAKKGSLSAEIATRDRSIDFYSLGMYLPNPDPVLKKLGKDIKVYTELLTDGHLGGCVSSRKAGVKSLEWEIDRGKAKSRMAKEIQKIFNDLDVDRIVGEMLNAPLFGYQPLEVTWTPGNRWYPADVVGKPQDWFVFDERNNLRFRTKQNYLEGEELPEKKFLNARHEATYANPYGFAELSRCFWPLTFKKGGYKFWVKFAEKYGMPWPIGKLPRGLESKEYDNLADMLEKMVQDGLAVIPDDSSIELLVAEGKGASGSIYKDLIQECKTECSIAILGQNLTTEVKGGSYAATQGHMKVREDIRDGDKKISERAFNTLIRWIYEYNYSERISALPTFLFYEEEDVDKDLAERDKTLSETGVRFKPSYYVKAYGLAEEDFEITAASSPSQTSLPSKGAKDNIEFAAPSRPEGGSEAFPDQTALDAAIESLDPAVLKKQMEGVLKPVLDLIAGGSSYEEIYRDLAETYPDMGDKVIQEMLARAIFVSEVWGRLNVDHA